MEKAKKSIRILEKVSKVNDVIAAENRKEFLGRGLVVINLLGSPGCGKTTLIAATAARLPGRPISVVEGDVAGSVDAEFLAEKGLPAIQINTGGGCHLDAGMVHEAMRELAPSDRSIVFIENVGNLICTAGYDLGEQIRVLALSTPEGDDKPQKYPGIFAGAEVLLITKSDVARYVGFDAEALRRRAHSLNPGLVIFEVSALKGDGMDAWCGWLSTRTGGKS
ncbi:MAG: hydrogenase nickel incorporation protein HypB [Candidatus Eisenbacteria bacterium]